MQLLQSKMSPSEASKLGSELRDGAAKGNALILLMLDDMDPDWPKLDDQRLGERFDRWTQED